LLRGFAKFKKKTGDVRHALVPICFVGVGANAYVGSLIVKPRETCTSNYQLAGVVINREPWVLICCTMF